MRVVAVDDEALLLEDFLFQIKQVNKIDSVEGFNNPEDALEYCKDNMVDVAFLDIQMPEMNGIVLAQRLKELQKDINIIFLTAYPEYSIDAMRLHASGYLVKPALVSEIATELEDLRKPVVREEMKRIYAHTFGNFDLFVDGKPLVFKRSKSKEILAYLIDRQGASVSKKELANVIWEMDEYNRTKQIQLQTLLSELMKSLKEVGAERMVNKEYNSFAVNLREFDCDYYQFLMGDTRAIKEFHDEYMMNYSWGECTAGYLVQMKASYR